MKRVLHTQQDHLRLLYYSSKLGWPALPWRETNSFGSTTSVRSKRKKRKAAIQGKAKAARPLILLSIRGLA